MTDDIKALRDALAEVNFFKKGGFSYTVDDWNKAANPLRIARLLDALEAATRDAERYRWLRQVAEGEASDGKHCPLIKLYGLQGAAEDAFLLQAPHLTAAIDAAMAPAPATAPAP
jgi:hypothetical protein